MSVAIVGPGMIGAAHARAWRAAGADVSYLVSRRADAALEDAPGARTVTDLGVVLADPSVDIVTICTPTPTHREFAVACLRAGKNVLLEKPIALTLDDAEAIVREADVADGVLMVAHVVRFFDQYRRVREVVESGAVGRPVLVRAERMIAPPSTPWWYDEGQSGGIVVDLGIHDIDQANLLLGEPLVVRSTTIGRLGPASIVIEYEHALAQLVVHARMPLHTPFATSLYVVGDGEPGDAGYDAVPPAESLGGVVAVRAAAGEHPLHRFTLRAADGTAVDGVEPETYDPYATQAAHFLECVASGSPSTIAPTEAAVTALRTALAARDSLLAHGAWVRPG